MGRATAAVVVALALQTAGAHGQSLPRVDSGHRPGPDILYAPRVDAPQLQNTGPWRASPILVSGTSAYRRGEFVYQDFLYDDHGARGAMDPTDPFKSEEFAFSPKWGTLTYPTDPVFANNAADLVELRVKPLGDATAFRVTLNTLQDAERTAFTLALGSSSQPRAWPHGAGVRSPATQFLTVHGDTAELRNAATGSVVTPAPSATVDRARRQIDVRLPRAAWNPGAGTVRMAAGVGLWDPAAGRYLAPQSVASPSAPGGAAPSGAALFNVAFRFDEPKPEIANPAINTIGEGSIGAAQDGSFWRERAQGDALADGDVSRFTAAVDFGKLATRTDDNSAVPSSGYMNRVLASRFSFGQGVDHSIDCSKNFSQEFPCTGRFVGQLQPYTLYVPAKPVPRRGFGLTLLLHGLSANHNEFLDSRHGRQLGDRGPGSIVASPLGRGPDGFYQDIAEADTFEVWADVARRYRLDPAWAATSGYSMGGIGSYRLVYRWPDLFARGAPIVGFANELEQLPSLRNVPVIAWNAGQDELVNPALYEPTLMELDELGLAYVADVFSPAGHITLAANDDYGPQAEFLGDHRVNRSPPHVTYVVAPGRDSARARAIADHAYWLSGLRVRNRAAGPGTVDARSEAFGLGDPPLEERPPSAGTLTGGSRPLAFLRRSQSRGSAPRIARRNFLDVELDNLSRASVDGRRAKLDGDEPLRVRVRSDGDGQMRLDVRLPAGATVERVGGPAVPGASRAGGEVHAAARAPEVDLTRGGATFRLAEGSRTYLIRPAGTGSGSGGGSGADGGGGGGQDGDGPVGRGDDGGGSDTAGTGTTDGGGDGGSLPFTGLALACLVLAGLILLLAGRALRRAD